jgi:hypothetical protein
MWRLNMACFHDLVASDHLLGALDARDPGRTAPVHALNPPSQSKH